MVAQRPAIEAVPFSVGRPAHQGEEPIGERISRWTQESLESVDAQARIRRLGQPVRKPARGALQYAREPGVVTAEQDADVASITRKQLISPDTGQRHLVLGANVF